MLLNKAAFPQKLKKGGIPPRFKSLKVISTLPVQLLDALLISWDKWDIVLDTAASRAPKDTP